MTTFTGPLIVKGLSSGLDNVGTKWEVSANGFVSGSTSGRFAGPLRNAAGGVFLEAEAVTVNAQTATAAASAITPPAGARGVNISYTVIDDVFATALADMNILIGTSGDDNEFATLAVSGAAAGFMQLGHANFTGVCGAALHDIGSKPVFIKTTAVSGAVTSKNALITLTYVR